MAAARQNREDRRAGSGQGQRGSGGRRRQESFRRSVRPGFSHEKALIFGVIQVLAGIAALILGVVSISTRAWGYYYAAGFWSGTLFFLAGVFGLASARRKSNCTIVTFMIFSAMSAILALVMLTLSAIGVATENMLFQQQQQQDQHPAGSNALAVHSLIIVVSVIAAICGTASSIVGCRAVCGVWYLPDNPYHSADLQTPTSAEFGVGGYRQNSNLQYLIDPDLRSQAQHLFASSAGSGTDGINGDVQNAIGTSSICPPASYEYPRSAIVSPPTLPPPSGPQQIAILAPAADGSMYGMVQASSDQAGGISQVMYIMPNTGPCPQPGTAPESVPDPPCTPPPSYSQINLTEVGLNDSTDSTAVQEESICGSRGSNAMELPGYSAVNSNGTASGSMPDQQLNIPPDVTFPTQLPPLDRLIPLTGTRVVQPHRSHRSSSGQHRPVSMTPSRSSGTQTCAALDQSTTGQSHTPGQRAHRTHYPSQRHSSALDRHRSENGHRRPLSDCRANSHQTELTGPVTCYRHSQSVGTQAGSQSRSGNGRSSSSRYHGSSSRAASCSGAGSASYRSSRSTRDRHKPSEHLGVSSLLRDSEQLSEHLQTNRPSSSSHLQSQCQQQSRTSCNSIGAQPAEWRLSGSFLTQAQTSDMASQQQELVVTSYSTEMTVAEPNRQRPWDTPSGQASQYSNEQSSNLSPLSSVL